MNVLLGVIGFSIHINGGILISRLHFWGVVEVNSDTTEGLQIGKDYSIAFSNTYFLILVFIDTLKFCAHTILLI